MATEFRVLHLQFEPPEPFSHETEKFRFEEDPFGSGRRLEMMPEEDQTRKALAPRFRKWLGRSFNSVELTEDREQDGHRVLRARAESHSGDPVQAVVATMPDQDGLRLRFLSVGDGFGDVWQSTLRSTRQEEKGHHGWLKDGSRRYQVKEGSLRVPEDWQDTTDYLLRAGSSSGPTLDICMKWEEEHNRTPKERVQSFLRRFQAADESVRIREDHSMRIDDHSGHYGSLTGTESSSRVWAGLVAVKTGGQHGTILYASGPEVAFDKYDMHWKKLLSKITVR